MVEFAGRFIKDTGRWCNVSGILVKDLSQPIGNAEGKISHADISVSFNDNIRRVGSMIVKEISPSMLGYTNYATAWPQEVMGKYRWLKGNKLPVVPTLRIDFENNRILMTDMTDNGNKIIIDRHSPIDTSIENMDALKEELPNIAERAFADGNGVYLNFDAYAIIVNNNGIGEICILDLGLGAYRLKGFELMSLFGGGKIYSLQEATQEVQDFFRATKLV